MSMSDDKPPDTCAWCSSCLFVESVPLRVVSCPPQYQELQVYNHVNARMP